MESELTNIPGFEDAENLFNLILEKAGVAEADHLMVQYREETKALGNVLLGNDRIAHYMHAVAYLNYKLSTISARQGLSQIISATHAEVEYAKQFLDAGVEEGKKLTKDDKAAVATVKSLKEKQVAGVLKKVEQALELRVKSLQRLNDNLKTLSMINMSEQKMSNGGN